MTAAVIDATLVGGSIVPGLGLKMGAYTATVAHQDDWIIFSDFSAVKGVYAEIVATGALNACTIDGGTLNKVVLTSSTTGAVRMLVWGI
jgi:hypothetical protein